MLPIAQPPWTTLGKKIESKVRKALFEFDLISEPKIAVALSGGKDSLTLLYLLKAISGRGIPALDITAVHVKGEFSCGPAITEGYLQKICAALEVPLVVQESTQKREKLECYSCSRERRRLLFEAAKERGITTIAFGHHRDDSVETLLMNLLHKAEFCANVPKVPMHDYGVTIVRPLLFVTENEIREFATMYGFARIVCQCPVGQNSLRSQTKSLIKQLEEVYPNVRQNLFQAALTYGSDKCTLR
ncbi:MAG: tRNA 2-thiocytidine biosynthesis protein TtcA [Verrucomicrobia bacterium]|nr:tRNA 2-thiocytidine biosynthesis protein TtcA [Verrucomicrobiota bacterium]